MYGVIFNNKSGTENIKETVFQVYLEVHEY